MIAHEKYMSRCLELAAKGFGKTAANPMVGCVIVHGTKIIGEGYHEKFGGPHAEVNAFERVKDKALLSKSTLYVNLEPCSHFGKTPPCADLIIRYKVKYVVIGTLDPNPIVSGRGVQKLISAGCDVKVGVCESACRELNRRFLTFHQQRRPYVILKWAQTRDKYIGIVDRELKITSERAAGTVHQWRSEESGILIGTNTAITDNPRLTVRKVKGPNPVRILLDRELRVPSRYHLLDKKVRTLIFTGKKKASLKNLEYIKVDFGGNVLKEVLGELFTKGIQSVMVEGGAELLKSFIKQGLWDEARVLTGKRKLSELSRSRAGIHSPDISGEVILEKALGADSLQVLRNISRSSL